MDSRYRFAVDDDQAGERLDVFLSALFPERSRSYIQKLISSGMVLCGREDTESTGTPYKQVSKAGTVIKDGEIYEISIPEDIAIDVKPENIPLEILYEDDDLLIVNKPKGMVVHPAPGHYSGTLVNAVLNYCPDSLSGIGGVLRPGVVHRIDKDTTGSVMICKNDRAHRSISDLLSRHEIDRVYHALVIGRMPEESGDIIAPIGRSPSDRKKMAVVREGQGKPAETHWKLIRYFPNDQISYVTCTLESGRTHQIRVHMSSIGHPVLGDEIYGGKSRKFTHLQGQCLHAMRLGFVHPITEERIEVDAPLPEYFSHLLVILS
ncbi:MAG: RluA family pseudouridine synthase [Lachnospiraceae bacterium]|nr:RluA family pseudouridine synthase [Lachnospiraceae bacterium]